MGVIFHDHYRSCRGRRPFLQVIIDQLTQGDNRIAVFPEIPEMGLENRRGYGHPVGNGGTEAMIEENGNIHPLVQGGHVSFQVVRDSM